MSNVERSTSNTTPNVQHLQRIRLAQSELGWLPTIPLEDGLARTIAYFRSSIA